MSVALGMVARRNKELVAGIRISEQHAPERSVFNVILLIELAGLFLTTAARAMRLLRE